MADGFNWTCPTCGSHTTITSPTHCYRTLDVFASNTPNNKGIVVGALLIECPNQQCLAQSFKVIVKQASRQSGFTSLRESSVPVGIGSFTFLPTTHPHCRNTSRLPYLKITTRLTSYPS